MAFVLWDPQISWRDRIYYSFIHAIRSVFTDHVPAVNRTDEISDLMAITSQLRNQQIDNRQIQIKIEKEISELKML